MFIADLHIHSRYARATSPASVPETLDLYARRKGLAVVGTGDFTHPAWRRELWDKLVPAEEGLYRLREENSHPEASDAPGLPVRFLVSGEISTIYKKRGRVHKVHHLILLPGLAQADALADRLSRVGNLSADGRPILGLDSRALLEMTLEACPDALLIPAHIWTPHFSLLGALSGFDAVEPCYEDLTPHIHALETGLSADPAMIWRVSSLDPYALISNSDAHSPQNLAREATLFEGKPSYPAIAHALRSPGRPGLLGTLEFFSEEGKYHYDGHRSCLASLSPKESAACGAVCPACGAPLTPGVLGRTLALADRPECVKPIHARDFQCLVPLPEVIAACAGLGKTSKGGQSLYARLVRSIGPELVILREAPLPDLERIAGPALAEGIRRLREGRVRVTPGYDGVYGKVELLSPAERKALNGKALRVKGEP